MKPTQVFDDGARIYVQFSDMKHVPAIFTETSSGRVLMSWELQFPYAVLTRPAQTLIFQLGRSSARSVARQWRRDDGAGRDGERGGRRGEKSANAATSTAANPAAAATRQNARRRPMRCGT